MLNRLCFIHIPRTSGTNFVTKLVSIYGVENSAPYYSMESYYSPELNRDYLLYGGHTNWKVRDILGPEFKYTTLLAEPINRAISHLTFIRDSGLTVNTEVDDLIFDDNPLVLAITNYQVNVLAPSGDLKEAINNLKELDWFGLKEYHQASWESFVKKFEIETDMVSYGGYRGLSATLTSKALCRLKDMVADSLVLYEFAKKEFLNSL